MTDNFDASKPSEGLGDTIAKITHAIGIDKVAEGVARAVGREDCGCNRRRQILNKIFPYSSSAPTPIPTPVDESIYIYEGVRNFRVLRGFKLNSNGAESSYEPGTVVSIVHTDPLYHSLKELLQQHELEYIPQ